MVPSHSIFALLLAFSFQLCTVARATAASCDAAHSSEAVSGNSCNRPVPDQSTQAGIALLAVQWHRTQRPADVGDGHLGDELPTALEAGDHRTSKAFDLLQEESSTENVPVLHEGISSKSIPTLQELAQVPELEEAARLKLQMSMNKLHPNEQSQSFASFNLSPAGPSDGLVGIMPARMTGSDSITGNIAARPTGSDLIIESAPVQATGNFTGNFPARPTGNSSYDPLREDPMSEEAFQPFSYPGAGLLLELHMPQVTLKELHSSSRGSLAQFLMQVRGEICKGTAVEEPRISILGIHGRYKRYESDSLLHMKSDRINQSKPQPSHIEEEVVVRFEILPGWNNDPDPHQAYDALKQQLTSPASSVMLGPLSTVLTNATVLLSAPSGMASGRSMTEHGHGMAHMSAMAWPIGISAAFIGVLIWLAAY